MSRLYQPNSKDILNKPFEFGKIASVNTLTKVLDYANKQYHNKGDTVISDIEYDYLRDLLQEKDPDNPYLTKVGTAVPKKEKRTLPYYLASLDKIKQGESDKLYSWAQNYPGPYLLANKLDGISALLIMGGGQKKLYTRGDGYEGKDISYLIKYLNIPRFRSKTPLAIRGELVIRRDIFDKYYSFEKKNPRNMVAGLVNADSIKANTARHMNFVVYELIEPREKPSIQFEVLKQLGFQLPPYHMIDGLDDDFLVNYFMDAKEKSKYDIDGIVISDDETYSPPKGENPAYQKAFKIIGKPFETTVIEVVWQTSRYGYLTPVVHVQPVDTGEVVISKVTGDNAKFIVDNNIGPGAIITLIRSGDVIPKIVDVIKQATGPQMPKDPFTWTKTGVDVVLVGESSNMKVKQILNFFTQLSIPLMKEGNITKLINAGYNSIEKILKMDVNDFATVPGFGKKTAQNLHLNIKKGIQNVPLEVLMAASGKMGRLLGKKKLRVLLEVYPDILEIKVTSQMISGVSGFGSEMTKLFIQNLHKFKKFIKDNPIINYYVPQTLEETDQALGEALVEGHSVVFSGFRDAGLENWIVTQGGTVKTGVSGNTTLVIAKNPSRKTGKVAEAEKRGIQVISLADFKEQFGI